MITIDSGTETLHLRAYSIEDYTRWTEQIALVRSQSMLHSANGNGDGTAALTEGALSTAAGSILQHSEAIHQKLLASESLIADLRNLASKEDSGTIQYLAPLGIYCLSLASVP